MHLFLHKTIHNKEVTKGKCILVYYNICVCVLEHGD